MAARPCTLVYCIGSKGPFSESQCDQMQGVLAQEGPPPFQASATPQMAALRLTRGSPQKRQNKVGRFWGALKDPLIPTQYTSP